MCRNNFYLIFIFGELLSLAFSVMNPNQDPNPKQKSNSIGRFQYHQQGLNGEDNVSYRFGFVSDDDSNPLSRHEISHGPGHVTGAYSYIDANNRWQIVHYESHPDRGFRIVKQWTKDRVS